MRLNYTDEEDFDGQFALWQANCRRSLKGKKGQVALKRLEAALVAMPEKRLIREVISEINTNRASLDVCALGAVAMMEGRDDILYSDGEAEEAGEVMGFPRLVAWTIVEQNDIQLDTAWEVAHGPVQLGHGHYKGGVPLIRDMTPEERYSAMLAWVRSQIREDGVPVNGVS